MSNPYLGEIRIFSFNYAPRGWATCSGQIIPIAQNQALFSLLGTTYGGDGVNNFALPDLRGRLPLHWGQPNYGGNVALGQKAGEETHVLSISEMPSHNHIPNGNTGTPNAATPSGNFWAQAQNGYSTTLDGAMAVNAIGNSGGNQAHENRSPFLTLLICIATSGVFPSRN